MKYHPNGKCLRGGTTADFSSSPRHVCILVQTEFVHSRPRRGCWLFAVCMLWGYVVHLPPKHSPYINSYCPTFKAIPRMSVKDSPRNLHENTNTVQILYNTPCLTTPSTIDYGHTFRVLQPYHILLFTSNFYSKRRSIVWDSIWSFPTTHKLHDDCVSLDAGVHRCISASNNPFYLNTTCNPANTVRHNMRAFEAELSMWWVKLRLSFARTSFPLGSGDTPFWFWFSVHPFITKVVLYHVSFVQLAAHAAREIVVFRPKTMLRTVLHNNLPCVLFEASVFSRFSHYPKLQTYPHQYRMDNCLGLDNLRKFQRR